MSMSRDMMKKNVLLFMKENKDSVPEKQLPILTKDVFADYPQDLMDEIFPKVDVSSAPANNNTTDRSEEEPSEPEISVILNLPADLVHSISEENIEAYIKGLIQQDREK